MGWFNNNNKFTNKVLLSLSDERIQDMIRRIVSGESASAPAVRPEAQAPADGRALKECERQVAQLQGELEQTQAQERERAAQVTQLQEELAQTRAQERECAEQVTQLQEELAQTQAQDRERAAQVTRLQGELAQTQAQDRERAAQVTRLQGELAQTQAQERERAARVTQLQGELAQTQAQERERAAQVTRLQGELAQTQAQERERAAQVTRLQGELAQTQAQERERAAAMSRLERELKRTQDKLSCVQNDVKPFNDVYAQYCALPKALKDNLKGYFCDQDVWTFLISGSQPDRIRDFWDYCRNDLARGRLPAAQREALLQIFNFFFDRINRSLGSEPQWRLQCVKPGEPFDSAAHSTTSDSASVGRVASVVWPGFLYATNNKVCRKSLVVVR